MGVVPATLGVWSGLGLGWGRVREAQVQRNQGDLFCSTPMLCQDLAQEARGGEGGCWTQQKETQNVKTSKQVQELQSPTETEIKIKL